MAKKGRPPLSRSESSTYRGYENYSSTSSTYDEMRTPVGVGLILRALDGAGIARERARLLDAGCGTGSYLVALRNQIHELDGLELNPGMLGRAREKLSQADNVSLHEGTVLAMPFADASFDAVVFNQVIHHLDDGCGPAWPNLAVALSESHRVLRPGGLLVINTCSQEQVRHGFWYNALIPDAIEKLARRYVPLEMLCALLTERGFDVRGMDVPLDELFGGERYLDPAGPFDHGWRNGDSVWALVSPAELEAALARLGELHDAGEALAFVRQQDQPRRTLGQAVFVQARRIQGGST
jgi:ubiquinone/menaquinone biosynthesis C-methylase UbiE